MCMYLNQINLFFREDKVQLIPCCQWFNLDDKELVEKYTDNINLDDFNLLLAERRLFVRNNPDICKKCILKTKWQQEFSVPETLVINIGNKCNLSCPYCVGRDYPEQHEIFKSFLDNREKLEKIISNPNIKMIQNGGAGEFFSNKPLMDLFLGWKEKYGKKIATLTNFTLYDPQYPLDWFLISWHKSADVDAIVSNLKKIPDSYKEKIYVNMMVGKYAFTLGEAYELVEKYLSPERFNIIYSDLFGEINGESLHGEFSSDDIRKVLLKTKYLGYEKAEFLEYERRVSVQACVQA